MWLARNATPKIILQTHTDKNQEMVGNFTDSAEKPKPLV